MRALRNDPKSALGPQGAVCESDPLRKRVRRKGFARHLEHEALKTYKWG